MTAGAGTAIRARSGGSGRSATAGRQPVPAGRTVAIVSNSGGGGALTAVVLNQAESVRLLDGAIPAYAAARAAAGAIARAAAYGAWRAEPRGDVPAFLDARTEDARAVVREYLRPNADGGWLSPGQAGEVLRCYGIGLADPARTADERLTGGERMTGGDRMSKVTVRVVHDPVFGPLVALAGHGRGLPR